jgi:hypothetical protein
MKTRAVAGSAITVAATALGFAAGGCGDGSTTSTRTTSMPQVASVEEIVDEHPDVVAIVCHNTEHSDHVTEHSHHEDSGHEHSHHEDSAHVAELEQRALGHVGPLAIEADVYPADLLDEFLSRC